MAKHYPAQYAPKAPLGSGARFNNVQNSVADEYEKKGMDAEKAEKIGAAVAAKAGRRAHGAKEMARLAKAGKK
jgi:hypothetical protein